MTVSTGALLFVSALALAAGCRDSAPDKPTPKQPGTGVSADAHGAQVVLAIGPRRITLAQFQALLGPTPARRTRQSEAERRRAFLDELVRTELLAIAAEQRGELAHPQAQARHRELMVEHMLDSLFGQNGTRRKPVTEAEVRAYYDENPGDFTAPEQVRVSHVLLQNAAEAQAVLRKAQQQQDPNAFAELARTHSRDPHTRSKDGDLGYFPLEPTPMSPADAITTASMRARVVPLAVREAAFTLRELGDVYGRVIASELGHHVVMLTGRKPSARYELVQVSRGIRERLESQRNTEAFETFIAELQQSARLEIDERKLDRVRLPK